MKALDRRRFLMTLPGLALAQQAFAQYPAGRIRIAAFNHVSLNVSDLKRSTEFYQGLFGLPIQSRQGATSVQLRIGAGPQFLNLSGAGASPGIDHMCVGVEGFDVTRILKVLADHGVAKSDQRGAMKVQVTRRGPDEGGAKDGTPEMHVGDPDGIDMQLQDKSYCGGAGPLGNVCRAVEPSAQKGLLALTAYSHCTVFSTDAQRSNAFYQQIFGMPFRSYQGPTAPTLAIGPTVEFLMLTGGGAGRGGASQPPRAASINHFCMNLEKFDSDQILKTLESYGIKPRESQTGAVGPLRHYISMRMENRGGAKEGTAELYFTDPDGILVQLQDVSYCGGAGVLGNVCPPVK
ncbi:MAG TPA: VOC family protein [Vicinamibacterales bacterium]|nr:VOC family protein [Vicinamibacterales bacterium]